MSLPLLDKITPFFSNQKAHVVKNLLVTAEGVFVAKTPNLNKVKDELGNILNNQQTTQPSSNYQRLTRFFNLDDETKKALSKSLLSVCFFVLGLKGRKPKYLALDGTSWEYGAKKIHLLTLCVIINGVSIPLCWEELDKKGMSNYEERKKLFDRACEWYDLSGMILLADREYIGEEWFKYLVNKGLDFVIRVKKGIYKDYVDTQRTGADKAFKHQKWRYRAMEVIAAERRYKNVGVAKQIKIQQHNYSFVVFKNPKENIKDPLIYFISTLRKKSQIVSLYPLRWKIETCFKHLKSNGFNLEEMNLKDSEKIKLMMGILAFLYTLCVHQGVVAYTKKKKSDYKKYKNGSKNLAVSIFRKGKAILAGKFYHLASFLQFLLSIISGKLKPKWVHV